MPDESTRPPAASDNSLDPWLNYIVARPKVKLDGKCLKQGKVIFSHKDIANIYIVYDIN